MNRRTILLLPVVLVMAGCVMPWHRSIQDTEELNLGFRLDRNQVVLGSVTVGGREGRFVLATAMPRTIVDPSLFGGTVARARSRVVRLGQRRHVTVTPAVADLQTIADALIGFDVWRNRVITIDYRKGLVTATPERHGDMADLEFFRFSEMPSIPLTIDGRHIEAIIDTTIPDTMIIPSGIAGGSEGRGTFDIAIAGVEFPATDVRISQGGEARIGNRLLAHFLVVIDYRRELVGLWPDARIVK